MGEDPKKPGLLEEVPQYFRTLAASGAPQVLPEALWTGSLGILQAPTPEEQEELTLCLRQSRSLFQPPSAEGRLQGSMWG